MAKLKLNLMIILRINLMGKFSTWLYLMIIFRINLMIKSNDSTYVKSNVKFSG
jgi:hypothetical protein